MKIAILADFPISALDGIAVGRGGGQGCTWLPQLALQFQNQSDFEIHWVILDRTIRKPILHQALGQHFHRVPSVKISIDLALNHYPARFSLGKILRKIQPDLVHAWGTETVYPAVLQDCKCPTILSMQGILTEYARIGGLPNDWRWRRMIASEPKFIRSATVVTSESHWGIDKVKGIHPTADCRMVEYGVHPSFYDLPWQPDPQVPYALFVGGSDRRKGLDILIEALRLLPERGWEMRFAGDDKMQQLCDGAGLKQVRCLGLLKWDEMQKQLQGAWCSLLPTRGDTSPNSVKEARVVGVPVVTSLHGGQAGYIKDGINGLIVDPLNAEMLAKALNHIMASYQNSMKLGKGHHMEDRQYLTPLRTFEGFAAIYHEFTGHSVTREA